MLRHKRCIDPQILVVRDGPAVALPLGTFTCIIGDLRGMSLSMLVNEWDGVKRPPELIHGGLICRASSVALWGAAIAEFTGEQFRV